jgi:hypothetical protein
MTARHATALLAPPPTAVLAGCGDGQESALPQDLRGVKVEQRLIEGLLPPGKKHRQEEAGHGAAPGLPTWNSALSCPAVQRRTGEFMRRIISPIAVATSAFFLSGCGVAGTGGEADEPHRIGESVRVEYEYSEPSADEEFEMSYKVTRVEDITDQMSEEATKEGSRKLVLVALAIKNLDSQPVKQIPAYDLELHDDHGDAVNIPGDHTRMPEAVNKGFGEFWPTGIFVKPGETRRGYVVLSLSAKDEVQRVVYQVFPFDRAPQWWASA